MVFTCRKEMNYPGIYMVFIWYFDPFWAILGYRLVNIPNNGTSPFLKWVNPLSMAIFNSYVKLPEGK